MGGRESESTMNKQSIFPMISYILSEDLTKVKYSNNPNH